MEYADDGDVFQRIESNQAQQKYMQERFIWQVFIQVAKGMQALHYVDILHRDLKSANIFLFKSGKAKLGDLNVSKLAKNRFLST